MSFALILIAVMLIGYNNLVAGIMIATILGYELWQILSARS